ncbi:MAG: hypothetical protein QXU40_02585 [Candidatus Pacearchaeota archaeon]
MGNGEVQMPAGFGGLVRFREEYKSRIVLKPSHVIFIIALIIITRVFLNYIY